MMSARSVIVLGASSDRRRFSNKAVRAYRELGYEVHSVNSKPGLVEGVPIYPSLEAVPGESELLLLYVRPEIGLQLIGQAVAKGVRRVFVNPGAGSPELVAKIRELKMEPIEECSIVAIGRSPSEFPG